MDEAPLQVVLIQPGQTKFDQEGRIQGTLDVPLSRDGVAALAETAVALQDKGLEVIYCSPCSSATETASTVAEALDIKYKALDKLQNVDYGLWQGLQIEDVKRKQPKVYKQWLEHPETVCPPEGETVSSAQDRVAIALRKLLKKHKQGAIGLVVPEPLASVVRSYLMQAALSEVWNNGGDGGGDGGGDHWEAIDVQPAVLTATE